MKGNRSCNCKQLVWTIPTTGHQPLTLSSLSSCDTSRAHLATYGASVNAIGKCSTGSMIVFSQKIYFIFVVVGYEQFYLAVDQINVVYILTTFCFNSCVCFKSTKILYYRITSTIRRQPEFWRPKHTDIHFLPFRLNPETTHRVSSIVPKQQSINCLLLLQRGIK